MMVGNLPAESSTAHTRGLLLTPESVSELRQILIDELGRPISLEEAEAVGRWLLSLYGDLL